MTIENTASKFKQAHQLDNGDRIALHYSTPSATVVQKVSGEKETVLIIVVPNDEPVRYIG